MKKKYIRVEEMKELFPNIPTLKSMKTSLKAELERVSKYDSKYDIIDSVNFSHELSNMPRGSKISDKTSTAIISICDDNVDDEKTKMLNEITSEIYRIDIVLEKIDIALNGLTDSQKQLLELKYWEEKTWNEIMFCMKTDKKFYSTKQLQTMNKKAIEKITIISMINIEMFEYIKKMIDRAD